MKPRGGLAGDSARYSKFIATLHWLMAALVILAYVTSEGDLNEHSDAPTVHALLGVSVLALLLPRFLGRLLGDVPSPLHTLSKRWTRLAGIGHATLYLLLFAVPLTGWFTLSLLGLNVALLGHRLPFLTARQDAATHVAFLTSMARSRMIRGVPDLSSRPVSIFTRNATDHHQSCNPDTYGPR
jgi:cytochrome b561